MPVYVRACACAWQGCDGSVLLESGDNQAEKNAPPNQSLRGVEVIDRAKARIEAGWKEPVSCADILAFAARDAANVLSSGAISYDVPSGRRDGLTSDAADASQSLPPPFAQLGDLVRAFASKGFGIDELVALSGAHSIGVAHCSGFTNRLYPDTAHHR